MPNLEIERKMLHCFERAFSNNSHYGQYDKISYIDSLAYTIQEFLYSNKVEDKYFDFRIPEHIKLYDLMSLVVYFIGPSVDEFGKSTIIGYIDDLKTHKYHGQREDVVEYHKEEYLLVSHASFELIEDILWSAYIYACVRYDMYPDEDWKTAQEVLYDLMFEESGLNEKVFKEIGLMKQVSAAKKTMVRHIAKQMKKQEPKTANDNSNADLVKKIAELRTENQTLKAENKELKQENQNLKVALEQKAENLDFDSLTAENKELRETIMEYQGRVRLMGKHKEKRGGIQLGLTPEQCIVFGKYMAKKFGFDFSNQKELAPILHALFGWGTKSLSNKMSCYTKEDDDNYVASIFGQISPETAKSISRKWDETMLPPWLIDQKQQ